MATDSFAAANRACEVSQESKLCSTNGMSAVVRPDWWCYPLQCSAGHPWAPGRVTVGWMPCDCPNAAANKVLGHLWVRCRAVGCPSIWYRPWHEPSGTRPTRDALGRAASQLHRSGTSDTGRSAMRAIQPDPWLDGAHAGLDLAQPEWNQAVSRTAASAPPSSPRIEPIWATWSGRLERSHIRTPMPSSSQTRATYGVHLRMPGGAG